MCLKLRTFQSAGFGDRRFVRFRGPRPQQEFLSGMSDYRMASRRQASAKKVGPFRASYCRRLVSDIEPRLSWNYCTVG